MDRLEAELGEQIIVIRINMQDPLGQELAPLYQARYTPTFVLFDAGGAEQWRSIGSFDPDVVRQFVGQ